MGDASDRHDTAQGFFLGNVEYGLKTTMGKNPTLTWGETLPIPVVLPVACRRQL